MERAVTLHLICNSVDVSHEVCVLWEAGCLVGSLWDLELEIPE